MAKLSLEDKIARLEAELKETKAASRVKRKERNNSSWPWEFTWNGFTKNEARKAEAKWYTARKRRPG